MKTLLVYASSHGTSEKVAILINKGLVNDNVTLCNLKHQKKIDPIGYDKKIIGGSIHAGTIQKSVKQFLNKHEQIISQKPLGLYLCGMEPNLEKQKVELETAFPVSVRSKARICSFVGGEFLFEKMNFFEKFIIKKIAKTDKSTSALFQDKISQFISIMQA